MMGKDRGTEEGSASEGSTVHPPGPPPPPSPTPPPPALTEHKLIVDFCPAGAAWTPTGTDTSPTSTATLETCVLFGLKNSREPGLPGGLFICQRLHGQCLKKRETQGPFIWWPSHPIPLPQISEVSQWSPGWSEKGIRGRRRGLHWSPAL